MGDPLVPGAEPHPCIRDRHTAPPPDTISLATAARMLGISFADSQKLAEGGQFPCGVLWTSEGYRVTLAALVRVLRRDEEPGEPGTEQLPPDAGEKKGSNGLGG